ncbi:hypothetical protein JM79_3238 [Gramella sp. Hel_I_59]|uniref:hypothetical protein n=1 Tax=Gramella sp. Hel_I_59 TaxID=1249978 RepID=UPI0011524903|nr:hypothetical protein [Gramella sp. Hel_I_59]TQI72280.1 hypothetical protein JM79_3238 [Gramella sp. Hel_I_59]
MNTTTYTLEEAITLMRNCSKLSKPFSIYYAKLGGGKKRIVNASLRPMASTKDDRNAKYKLQLRDNDNHVNRSCYIPLLMEVNGIEVKLK